jgi:hypothetical protein
MPRRALLAGAGAILVLGALAMLRVAAPDVRPRSAAPPRAASSSPSAGDLRSYAVALPELRGLAPDADPGARLELWVTWGPPFARRPRIERLTRQVVLKRIVPPLTPGAPDTALLLVPEADIPALLYADRYGALNATLVPS